MTIHRTLLSALLAAAVVALYSASIDASPSMPTTPSYSEILDLYRRGQIDAALSALAMLSDEDIRSGQKLAMKALDESGAADTGSGSVWLRAAALVHTHAALRLPVSNAAGIQRHLAAARTAIDKIAARGRDDSFVRDWWVMLISYFQGQLELSRANELGSQARDAMGDTPELFLAIGVTQEMAWTRTHDDEQDYPLKGDLRDAESAYRKALAAQPDLVEARVRLGRVLTLRGDSDGALRTLDAIRSTEDPVWRYLGHLFEGDALERAARVAEAEQRYLAAFAAWPEGQSARMALAHLRHAHGARAEAANEVRATAANPRVAETWDPWFWYSRGLYWRVGGYLQSLQAQVQQ